jgi:hypothetical protein
MPLCYLGASVNLMPKSIFKTLGIGNLKLIKISLQLADGSVRLPIGILEDIPVRVGKFFFPTDFIIINAKNDLHSSILLDRPFLVTAGADINVRSEIFFLNLGREKKIIITKYDKSLLIIWCSQDKKMGICCKGVTNGGKNHNSLADILNG